MKQTINFRFVIAIVITLVKTMNSFGQVSIPPPSTLPTGWTTTVGNEASSVPGFSGTFVGVNAGFSNSNANFNSGFGYKASVTTPFFRQGKNRLFDLS